MQKVKQDVSWLREDYLAEKNWIIKRSPFYIFHYFKNSLAEKEINQIIKIQESAYKKILKNLKLKNKRKIRYYIYPSEEIKERLMGDSGNGNAIWIEIKKEKENWKSKKIEVHCIYSNKVKCIGEHEDTHLLSLLLGVATFLFSEGLAEFMSEKWDQKDIDFWTKKYLKRNKLYSLEFLIDNKNWNKINEAIVYPQAGSFVRYLIKIYGLEKFKEVYKNLSRNKTTKQNIKVIKKIYFKSIRELEENWKEYLDMPQ